MTDYSTIDTLEELDAEFERVNTLASSDPNLAVVEARALTAVVAARAIALLDDDTKQLEDAELPELMAAARNAVLPAFEDATYSTELEGIEAVTKGIYGRWASSYADTVLMDVEEDETDEDYDREFHVSEAEHVVVLAQHWCDLVLKEVLVRDA